jgi:hypothetical protein
MRRQQVSTYTPEELKARSETRKRKKAIAIEFNEPPKKKKPKTERKFTVKKNALA